MLEEKISKTNDDLIDTRLNNSNYIKYVRLTVDLIIKDNGDQWEKIKNALAKYGNEKKLRKRLIEFIKGKIEDKTFIADLEYALNLSKRDFTEEDDSVGV